MVGHSLGKLGALQPGQELAASLANGFTDVTQSEIKSWKKTCVRVTNASPSERTMHGGKRCHREPELAPVLRRVIGANIAQPELYSSPAACKDCLS